LIEKDRFFKHNFTMILTQIPHLL